MIPNIPTYMVRRPECCKTLGKGRTAFYNDINNGLFPPPVYVTSRTVAWPSYELNAVMNARIAGKPEEEIKELVTELIALRRKTSPTADKSACCDNGMVTTATEIVEGCKI